MSTTDNGATITPISDAPSAKAAETEPVRATWKVHGNPAALIFHGANTKPVQPGIPANITVDRQGLTLVTTDGDPLARFGTATKFWAVVAAETPEQASARREALLAGETDDERDARHQAKDVRDADLADEAKITDAANARKAEREAAKLKRDAERADAKAVRDAAKAERETAAAARKTEREAKAAAKAKAADERAKAKANKPAIPAGYEVKYPHRTYLLVKIGAAKDDAERIVVMCRQHGTLKPAKNMQDADAIGAKPNRPTWCRGCKTAAAKAAAN